MTDFQRGLNTDIAKYKKDCLDKDRCDGKGKWTAIPRSIDEMANRPIDPPVIRLQQRVQRLIGERLVELLLVLELQFVLLWNLVVQQLPLGLGLVVF